MMDALQDRLRKCADLAGSGDALSQKTGIPRNTLQTYLMGQAEPKIGRVVDIAHAAGVNIEWLATGKGPMRPTDEPQAATDEFVYIRKARARLSGGDGYWAEEDFYSELYSFRLDWMRTVSLAPSKCILMDVYGDSMSPDIKSGDTAMIDTSKTDIVDGNIYALAEICGKTGQYELKIKALYRSDDNILIVSYNAPESIKTQFRPAECIRVLGEVVWIGRVLVSRQGL